VTNGMKWKVETTPSGAYKLTSQTGSGYVLATDSSDASNGVKLVQGDYIQNNSYRDEWELAEIGFASTVEGEGQKMSQWCWAASSRMFSKHYFPQLTYTQNQAVAHIKGSEVNDGGTVQEAQAEIDFYVSNVGTIDTTEHGDDTIYSEETMIQFLEDGHVLYVTRGWYENMNNRYSRYGGHAIFIVGYATIDSDIRFLVQDPDPIHVGDTYWISYEKLCCGTDPQDGEIGDKGVWEAAIVFDTSYADTTVPYYFDR